MKQKMQPNKNILMKIMKVIIRVIFSLIFSLIFVLLLFIVGVGNFYILQTISSLLFGWLDFFQKVILYINVNPIIIFEGILIIFCLIGGTHWFLSSTLLANAATRERVKWKLKWSIALIGIFLLMFVTSISITGLVHQAGWLVKSPFTESDSRWTHYRNRTKGILREMGRGLESYSEANQHLPIVSQPIPFKNVQIPQKYYNGFMVDQWGMPILYSSDGNSYVLRSYGKNKILGGGAGEFDDLLYSDGELLGDRRGN